MQVSGVTKIMEADFEPFQVDYFVSSLRELHEEQQIYEQRVSAARGRRLSLERKLETVTAKHAQVQDRNNKMLAVQKAANHKIALAQDEAARLERLNMDKKARIAELNALIDEEEKGQMEDLHNFEDKLTEIAGLFRSGVKKYEREALQEELIKYKAEEDEVKEQATKSEQMIEDILQKIENLHLEVPQTEDLQQDGKRVDDAVPLDTWQSTIEMFKEESCACQEFLEGINLRLEQIHTKKARLEEEIQLKEEELEEILACEQQASSFTEDVNTDRTKSGSTEGRAQQNKIARNVASVQLLSAPSAVHGQIGGQGTSHQVTPHQPVQGHATNNRSFTFEVPSFRPGMALQASSRQSSSITPRLISAPFLISKK